LAQLVVKRMAVSKVSCFGQVGIDDGRRGAPPSPMSLEQPNEAAYVSRSVV
jgi:hypothetical protein